MFDFIPQEVSTHLYPTAHELIVNQQYPWDIPLNAIAEEHLATMTKEELDSDWRLNEFFGTIAVINLPQDKKRLVRITKELNAVGTYEFEVFPAIDGRKDIDPSIWSKFTLNRLGNNIPKNEKQSALDRLHQGEAGCYMSHYLLIKRTKDAFDKAINDLKNAETLNDELMIKEAIAKVHKYSRILILEDDNGFGIVNPKKKTKSSRNNSGTLLREAIKTLPKAWDMLYLMCAAHQKSQKISEHLYQIKRSAFANAYVINYTMYDPILAILAQIEDPSVKEVLPLDKAISYNHFLFNVYAIYPSIAYQYNGISSIDSTSKPTLTQCQPILKKP